MNFFIIKVKRGWSQKLRCDTQTLSCACEAQRCPHNEMLSFEQNCVSTILKDFKRVFLCPFFYVKSTKPKFINF